MSPKVTGFDELQKKLKKMSDGAKELEGKHQIPVPELLTESFITAHTKFKDAQELFDESGYKIDSPDDFKAIPNEDWDKYIVSASDFNSWKEMLKAATVLYAKQKMGL